jgi:type VI secretion system secreted protein VgrG
MEEVEAGGVLLTGASNCRAFSPGYRFDLVKHPYTEMNKTYLLTQVQHTASVAQSYATGHNMSETGTYSNQFTCIPYEVPYRPARITPKPVIPGVQTAIVTGKKRSEIDVDEYGRVYLHFHWDREGTWDENSSCRVRVSQSWTGKNWGHIANPHVSEEVIVAFLEGDPDRPIIVGRVYNAEHMPPYELPGGASIIGMKSQSTKTTGIMDVAAAFKLAEG